MRIGHGYDVHRFGEGDHVILGGVKIPYTHGLIAHSDGDVLLHAVCDALLGAAALGDIGKHFPDTEAEFAGINSRQLLCHVGSLINQHGFSIVNIDVTLIAEAPKVSTYTSDMCRHIAMDLAIAINQVNVKATTTEKLGFIGQKQGIACESVCLITDAVTA